VIDIPDQIRRLAEQRDAAREARDFGVADALRERIREGGYEVEDTPEGTVLKPVEAPAVVSLRPNEVVSLLDQPVSFDATIQWIVEGWPQDVRRGVASFDRHHPDARVQHVVVDLTATFEPDETGLTEVLPLRPDAGWATGRNAGLVRSLGRIVVVADGSVEATGQVLGPLSAALRDPTVGVTGPFGIVTDDLREFRESAGPDVDAVEGYLMAFRRDLVAGGVRFNEKFRFYRTADIELSFQVKAMGLRATVTPAPVVRHEHRMWTSTPEDRRAALSKRNYYRFLDRWRGRFDLTVAGGGGNR